ncbi:MAG: heat-inducible transcriptional repressor HrcA [Tessaracoccus sp.]
MLDDRKLQVLKAIITDYVASREPVGSKALVERHNLDVSAATVRNDMAALEEEGYITQPHTSAGRIPTDKGYRLFVDKLARIKPLSAAERRAIDVFMMGAVDVDDLVSRTVRLLAQLTRQVAIVQYPVAQGAQVKHVELVQLSADRVLIILVKSTGRVDQHMIEVSPADTEQLMVMRNRLADAMLGRTVSDAAVRLGTLVDVLPLEERGLGITVVTAMLELLAQERSSQVLVAGVPNVASFGRTNATLIRPLLEAIEEQVVLLQLLSEAASDSDLTIRIGQENTAEGFQQTSLIASGYGSAATLGAGLGVVGPTLMDYPTTIATVRAVARYVSRYLSEG